MSYESDKSGKQHSIALAPKFSDVDKANYINYLEHSLVKPRHKLKSLTINKSKMKKYRNGEATLFLNKYF